MARDRNAKRILASQFNPRLPPTQALVQSQLILSFGIGFAVVPLVALTASRRIMGEYRNPAWLTALAWVVVAAVLALNVAVIATA